MSDFEVGDSVRLRTGGPVMTINDFRASGKCECVWFDGDDDKSGLFSPDALEYADDEDD